MKKHKHNKLFLFVLFTGLLLGAFSAFFVVSNYKQPSKTYHSPTLKISFSYPSDFTLKEQFGTITLTNPQGQITIDRIGTDYETIDDYLQFISKRNHLIITDKQHVTINNHPAVVAIIHGDTTTTKTYFVYPSPWTIISISTQSPTLYLALEKTSRSFSPSN